MMMEREALNRESADVDPDDKRAPLARFRTAAGRRTGRTYKKAAPAPSDGA